jgi:hypothetical protein
VPEPGDLALLAERINAAHRRALRKNAEAVAAAIEAGNDLAVVKRRLTHGQWIPWVAENFDGSLRTAQVYVQVARHPEDAQAAAHLGLAAALDRIADRGEGERPPAYRRPRAVKRAEDLADAIAAIARDAERNKGRTEETVGAYSGPPAEVFLAIRVLALIARRYEPPPALLCPVCDQPALVSGRPTVEDPRCS